MQFLGIDASIILNCFMKSFYTFPFSFIRKLKLKVGVSTRLTFFYLFNPCFYGIIKTLLTSIILKLLLCLRLPFESFFMCTFLSIASIEFTRDEMIRGSSIDSISKRQQRLKCKHDDRKKQQTNISIHFLYIHLP